MKEAGSKFGLSAREDGHVPNPHGDQYTAGGGYDNGDRLCSPELSHTLLIKLP